MATIPRGALGRLAHVTTASPPTPRSDGRHGAALLTPTAAPSPSSGAVRSRLLVPAVLLVLLASFGGVLAHAFVVKNGLGVPNGSNIFFVLYARHELPFIALTALFAVVALTMRGNGDGHRWPADVPAPTVTAVGLLAIGVLLIGWLASSTLFHQFGMSMDEYNAHFQARIFASGHLTAPVPEAFRGVTRGITPIFSTYLPQTASWTTMYLPVYSAMRALFLLAGAEWLTNPVLAAASVILLAAVARRIWPDDGGAQWIALLLLVTSSQFLITAATAYAMPAHLCLNLLWLWLWLRGDRPSLVALPLVGVLALGLHNPFPHALFVAPFLVHLLVTRRWRMTAWTAAVYAAGSLYWLHWLAGVQPQAQHGGAGGLFSIFQLPGLFGFVVQGMSLTLLTTWQTPLVALGLTAALLRIRTLAHPLRELMFGVLLSFGFYLLFPSAQGHGWGYRYIFPVLGGMALLAADGWSRIATELRPRAARALLVGGLALVLVQLPVRAVEVEATVRPYATATEYVQSLPADVVVLPVWSWWYGLDLVRNDPWFAGGPVVLAAPNVTEKQFNEMITRLGGKSVRVWTVPYAGLARFGMRPPFPVYARPSARP